VPEKLTAMRLGALSLWVAAIALGVTASIFDEWALGDLAIVAGFGAFALDIRRFTITSVQSVIQAMSLWHDDVQQTPRR
jgi:hypothetical protein